MTDRSIIASYKGELLFPVFCDYLDEKFGRSLAVADFRDPLIQSEITEYGWAVWPLVRYSYSTLVSNKTTALALLFWLESTVYQLFIRGFRSRLYHKSVELAWNR
ncbi:hypothetical protein X471_01093 [Bartonella bacilliformis str. Heidi Mejia]|nr:hypothetical protein [Bartonella bacilliformis]EYS88997.1 hypothetical protein X472_01086 [Bartonella bacilliformis San Pedro600-02]EYS90959.1 hypothetical protein X471_01093 [Bartonella bacilliformis str. Heidi Mejia]KEG17463.1 hypothetical protein H707_01099 [Bartonella bacilliformis Hosp800-02]KEG19403.1 hypothetical protein H704_01116 [Bartonella bacilliformis Peru38]KEG21593.1 hypothetical protein H703_01108 [Bartonella bacilliformis Ver075]